MSLLKCLRLRAAHRPFTAVVRQSSSDSPASSSTPPDAELPTLYANLAAVPDTKPPLPPPTAYPAPNPPAENPLTSARQRQRDDSLRLAIPYGLHVRASPNNTIVTITRPNNTILQTFTGGKCGFKRSNRNSYEAGYQCVTRAFQRLTEEHTDIGPMKLELFLNGFGQGRDALYRALMASEGMLVRPLVSRVTDKTPIKIGGTRAKKMRRR